MVPRRRSRRHEAVVTAEAIREVGVLFVALAPLDVAFSATTTRSILIGLIFVLLGLSFFGVSLKLEKRHGHR